LLPYILFEKYIYILAPEIASQGTTTVPVVSGTLSVPIAFNEFVCQRGVTGPLLLITSGVFRGGGTGRCTPLA